MRFVILAQSRLRFCQLEVVGRPYCLLILARFVIAPAFAVSKARRMPRRACWKTAVLARVGREISISNRGYRCAQPRGCRSSFAKDNAVVGKRSQHDRTGRGLRYYREKRRQVEVPRCMNRTGKRGLGSEPQTQVNCRPRG